MHGHKSTRRWLKAVIAWISLLGALQLAGCSPNEKPSVFTNELGMQFVLIRAGEFEMGARKFFIKPSGPPPEQMQMPYRDKVERLMSFEPDELPQRTVLITKDFYMGRHEVTQAQWKSVMGSNPSFFKGDDLPVESVSFSDVRSFLEKLNQMDPNKNYRLPTETQWEYVARAGTSGLYYGGDSPEGINDSAWYYLNSKGRTHPVGRLSPNRWGLYDMVGNVWELCSDWYDNSYYRKGEQTDPKGPKQGVFKVIRGSSWYQYVECCRVADRENTSPDFATYDIGFRLVFSADNQK